jgi:hypothetical protein
MSIVGLTGGAGVGESVAVGFIINPPLEVGVNSGPEPQADRLSVATSKAIIRGRLNIWAPISLKLFGDFQSRVQFYREWNFPDRKRW